jgi:2-polyprenyl-6-methoxyphenol hydroxylase-like FAD-dependent oxidoreductase
VFFQQRPEDVARLLWPGLQYTDTGDFLMWALTGRQSEFIFTDEQLFGASAEELHRLALQVVKGCHPSLSEFVEAAVPDRTFSLAIRAVPAVAAWPSNTRITFVGDAIHASPVNGTGANAALEDAAHLCRYLTGGVSDLQRVVDEYNAELLQRMSDMRTGFAAARSSMTGVL